MRTLLGFLLVLFMASPALSFDPASVPRMAIEELKAKMDKGESVAVVDVRSKKSYEASDVKIKGAIRIAPEELNDRAGELPIGKEMAFY